MADYDGYDAIILLDTNFPTHIGIVVEDENGIWWHFYWGAAGAARGSSSSLGFNVKVNTWCVQYDGALTLNAINGSGQWSGTYEKKMYLVGDFSVCVEEMKTIGGKYSLYKRNCSQVSLSILSMANTEYTEHLDVAKNKVLPQKAFNYMKDNAPTYSLLQIMMNRIIKKAEDCKVG